MIFNGFSYFNTFLLIICLLGVVLSALVLYKMIEDVKRVKNKDNKK